MKKLFLTIFFITGLFSSQAWSNELIKGVLAYQEGDYKTAYNYFLPLAEHGNAKAQYRLGKMWEDGLGTYKHYKSAVKWYVLSAEQGNYIAQNSLSYMFYSGKGVIEDPVLAHMWANIARSNSSQIYGNKFGDSLIEALIKKMTPSQIEKAQDLARECVKKNYKGC